MSSSARTLRRAVERKALKEARKQARKDMLQADQNLATAKQALADHLTATNCELPTTNCELPAANCKPGPRTEAGKAISSMNALTHGLTSKLVLMPSEDPEAYACELNHFLELHAPQTREELLHVETIVHSSWRLARLRRIESAMLHKGCVEALAKDPTCSPEVEAYLKYEKSLRNLHIQEARLLRQVAKAEAELKRLKAIRRREEAAASAAQRHNPRQAPPPEEFVFSTAEPAYETEPQAFAAPPPYSE